MEIFVELFIFSFVLCCVSGEDHSWTLSIWPAEFVTMQRMQVETVVCIAEFGTSLTDCGFQLEIEGQEHYYNASLGTKGEEDAKFGPFTVKYEGHGLDRGECGIAMKAPDNYKEENLILGCRVRTENSGWKYNYTNVVKTDWHPDRTNLQTVPRLPFLLPGSNLTVRCDNYRNDEIQNCSFTLPGQEAAIDIDENYKPQAPFNLSYVGEGLDKGQCGIFIPNVSMLDWGKWNNLTCETQIDRKTFPSREISVIVADPPSGGPTLTFMPPGYWKGSIVTFQCEAPASRPPATLAWYLDDQPLPDDVIVEQPVGQWRWGRDEEAVTQFATLNLTEQDQGKELTCVMSHMALAGTRNSTLTLRKGKSSASSSTPDRVLYASIVITVAVKHLAASFGPR